MAKERAAGTGWFASPNEIFDRTDLSAHEKLVLLYLCRTVGPDGKAWPSYSTIAKACGICRRSAIDAVRALSAKSLIEVENRRGEAGQSSSNLYHLRFGRAAGATGAPGVVQEMHQGGAAPALGVVQDMHRGGAPGAPEGHPMKVTQEKDNAPPSPSETPEQASAPRAPRRLADSASPTQRVLGYFGAQFESRFGAPPKLSFGKDGKIAKELVGLYGEEKVRELIDAFFASRDDFAATKAGYTFGVFATRVNTLLSVGSPPRASPDRDACVPRWLAAKRFATDTEGDESDVPF